MLIIICSDYEQMSLRAADLVSNAIRKKPSVVLGLATGSTPLGLYRELVRRHKQEGLDFSRVITFNLDEYWGLEPDHPQSFHYFMDHHFVDHINIKKENVHIPNGIPGPDLQARCEQYEKLISDAGGIDLQIVGIGKTGHIGFNEPTSSFASRTRMKTLTAETRKDNQRFFGSSEEVPVCAITMGIGTILEARRIVLLGSGKEKAAALAKAIEGPLSASVSASVLQLHRSVTVIVDEEAASELRHRDYYKTVLEMTARLTPERLE
ncbi:MAG TPA: glucosamine-6-phosphate deaminase [Acidobacteriota bacterium]|nr:glucosamine-6-phosphate deaminase [Acidobacteriota bacterium]